MTTAQIAAYVNQSPDPGQIYKLEDGEAELFAAECASQKEVWVNKWLTMQNSAT